MITFWPPKTSNMVWVEVFGADTTLQRQKMEGDTLEEIKLVKKAMRGNTKAYGQLIGQYKELLYRVAYLRVQDEELALDMVSETIVRGYEHVHKLRQAEYFKTWLVRILLNVIGDHYRSERRSAHAGGDAVPGSMIGGTGEGSGTDFGWEEEGAVPIADAAGSPAMAERADLLEERMDLAAALSVLPEKQRMVIILKYYNDMKISEIARVLDMPEGSVKAYLHNGREALRGILQEEYIYG